MTQTQLNEKIKAFIGENKDNIVRDIGEIVAYKSILGDPCEGGPFGAENKKVLEKTLDIANEMGLYNKNCEGYVGFAQVMGESEQYIATITHLDVVPEGNGWKGDPFTMRNIDGWLIGRGVCDNKGPAILTLYLLKFFKENFKTLPYTLRAIFGCEEETGMRDVEYYLENYPPPAFVYSPDANFPVCCGEKGIVSLDLMSKKIINGNVIDFKAGIASNVIPDEAFMTIKADVKSLLAAEGVEIQTEGDAVLIKAIGIGGHAAMPSGTKNAIGVLVNYCLDNKLLSHDEEEFFNILALLHKSYDGKGVMIDAVDDIFDPLTCAGGMIEFKDSIFVQNINVRYPTTTSGENITEILSKLLATVDGSVKCYKINKPFYVDKGSEAIQALLSAYNDATGENEQPYTIGGGTYSRCFPSGAAFGIEPSAANIKGFFPDFVGEVHGAEEGYSVDGFMTALEILISATYKLMQIEF